MCTLTETTETEWINPVGGLGDALILSGVLKLVNDTNHARKFHLVRRTKYLSILKGHPAIISAGFPKPGAKLLTNHYWHLEELGPGNQRPFQVVARLYGLKTPVGEKLYMPEFNLFVSNDKPGGKKDEFKIPDDKLNIANDNFSIANDILWNFIPWKRKNILFAPYSDSPRKSMSIDNWQRLADKIAGNDVGIFIAGKMYDYHRGRTVKNTYSLKGLTTPRQLIYLLRRMDTVVTCDNFILHAAHLTETPTVSLWGPTDAGVYGYPRQIPIKANIECKIKNQCITSRYPGNYQTECPLKASNCMDTISVDSIVLELNSLFKKHYNS